jgi:hypothetical protein
MDGDLVVCSHQVDLGEDGTTEKLMRVVVDMADGVVVWDGLALSALLLPQGCQPLSFLGTMCREEDQELSEWRSMPSCSMALNLVLVIVSRSGASCHGWHVTGGPGIVWMWWMVLWCTSRWIPAG